MARRHKPKRQYTEADRATALALLAANGGNVGRTARELQMPEPTLRKWAADRGINQALVQKYEQKKEELSDLFETVVRTYLARALEPALVNETAGKDAVTAAAIATDKMQLLRGEPTSRSESRIENLTDAELDARIKELEGRLYAPPSGTGKAAKRPAP